MVGATTEARSVVARELHRIVEHRPYLCGVAVDVAFDVRDRVLAHREDGEGLLQPVADVVAMAVDAAGRTVVDLRALLEHGPPQIPVSGVQAARIAGEQFGYLESVGDFLEVHCGSFVAVVAKPRTQRNARCRLAQICPTGRS